MADQLTISALKDLTKNEPCKGILRATVLEVSRSVYKTDKTMATVIADVTGFTKCLVYDTEQIELFKSENGIIIEDFIPKDGCIVVTKCTHVYASSAVPVPETIRSLITGTKMTALEAATSPKKTTVASLDGIIVKSSPTENKRVRKTQEDVPFKKLKVRDSSGSIEVCLWRDLAKTKVERGDCVSLKNFAVTDTFNSSGIPTPAITNKASTSQIEIIPRTDELESLLDEDLLDDDVDPVQPSCVIGFGPFSYYSSCINPPCYRKKLVNHKCPKCGITYAEGASSMSLNASLKVEGKAAPLIFFTQQAEQLKEGLHVQANVTDKDFHQQLVCKLPFSAKLQLKDNKITSIVVV